ncbi:Thiol peroxidase, Bcp-type [Thioalkalivibrio nitratireducens DSM 14787]|uniref:thioredoxin-dependent peroxiredoxin n=1 Tax=Thioalkalivibrio nitratireducens (strain DSM 14787 / UNIQEM 213 / ALEN2) TaxID=1255043 RepID=L0E193_THIND|nr:peroxiredoxin [Thioalkalivibrio nitratireducens]AGA35073.1 Thiol peroxidase, Bcp-type [Thioalkalivibrio nitratireducens DSM 14787]
MSIAVDQTVPADLRLPATGDQSLALGDFAGRRIVLYFYPKDSTPGCTSESRDFAEHQADFDAANAVILGVSRDSLASHERFRSREGLTFDLLSDTDEALCEAFGVIKMKNMYGKQVRGIERSTFLIDEHGVLRREWRKVKVPGHVAEVLAAVRER